MLLTGGGQITVRGTSDEVLALLHGAAPVDLDATVTTLRLSQRARLALDSIGVRTVGDLVSPEPRPRSARGTCAGRGP